MTLETELELETWECPQCSFYEITDEPDIVDEGRRAHLEMHALAALDAQVDDTDRAGVTDLDRNRDEDPIEARPTRNGNRWRQWSEAAIYDSLKAYAAELGRTPSTTDWLRATHERPALGTVKRVCGSWSAALVGAGLDPVTTGRRRNVDAAKGTPRPSTRKRRRCSGRGSRRSTRLYNRSSRRRNGEHDRTG